MPPKIDWENDPGCIELMNFLIERTKDAKSPLNIKQLAREFKEKSGSSLNFLSLVSRIRKLSGKVAELDTIDKKTKVKMMFALSVSIDKDFLNDLRKDADVEVDGKNRITKYRAKDGRLELEGDQSFSAKMRDVLKPKMDSEEDSRDVSRDSIPKTSGSMKRSAPEVPNSSKRTKVKSEESAPDSAGIAPRGPPNPETQLLRQPKLERNPGAEEAPIFRSGGAPRASGAPVPKSEANDVYTPQIKFLEAIQFLILNLDTPSLSPLQEKIDEKLRESSPNAKIANDEMKLAMELLATKITNHSVTNLPEHLESIGLKEFLCFLQAAILYSKLDGLEVLMEKIRGRIKEPASKEKVKLAKMPRGPMKDAVSINGWLMIDRKTLKSGETLYYCSERDKGPKCPGAFAVHPTTHAIRVVNEHENHQIDLFANATRFARQELKRRACDGPVRDVIDSVRHDFGPRVSIAMGDYNAKRRIVYSEKKREDPDRKLMDDGGAIVSKYAETLDGKRFLLSDHTYNSKRVTIFASDSSLQLLSSANVVLVDGTFACTPKGYCQLFSFHIYLNETVRPVLYALLPDKLQDTYRHLLEVIKNLPQLLNWQPEVTICDFELGIKNAFEEAFPNTLVHGCFFHLLKAWSKHAEDLKVLDQFTSGIYQDFWAYLKVLPFVDDIFIKLYFDLILETLPQALMPEMNSFINYLEKFYIGTTVSEARYQPKMWSCSLLSVNSIHRTTNTVECWHRLLRTVVHKHNNLASLKLSDLISKLQQEEAHTLYDSRELALNPNFKVTKSRTVRSVLRDKRLVRAIENNPPAPQQPLMGLQLLDSFILAAKY